MSLPPSCFHVLTQTICKTNICITKQDFCPADTVCTAHKDYFGWDIACTYASTTPPPFTTTSSPLTTSPSPFSTTTSPPTTPCPQNVAYANYTATIVLASLFIILLAANIIYMLFKSLKKPPPTLPMGSTRTYFLPTNPLPTLSLTHELSSPHIPRSYATFNNPESDNPSPSMDERIALSLRGESATLGHTSSINLDEIDLDSITSDTYI